MSHVMVTSNEQSYMRINCKYWCPCGVWIKVYLAGVVIRSICVLNMIKARGRRLAVESIDVVFFIVEIFI